nr:MAG TPA: hypothetical protein [Inoviridae sp.]
MLPCNLHRMLTPFASLQLLKSKNNQKQVLIIF